MKNLIRKTTSICPVCLERLPAEIVKREQSYFIEKTCTRHGAYSSVIWRGEHPSFEHWGDYSCAEEPDGAAPDCPNGCGLCPGHLQKTCCAVVEVTNRCNLHCPFCFAQSGNQQKDPSIGQLEEIFRKLVNEGNAFVQLSGGEPSMREDLPDIIAIAKAAGCETIQLNSNGVRIGADKAYLQALAQAGLSFVFMQFDGANDDVQAKLRGRPLLKEKIAAIQACSEERIGVALAATLVPGINDHCIGEIVNFGLAHSPSVRGVHFQPVSYFGRYPAPPVDADRITLPEVLQAIERQTEGKLKIADFVPSSCDHPRCGFHGDFVVMPDSIRRLTPQPGQCCARKEDGNEHLKNRNFVARRWKRDKDAGGEENRCCTDYGDMEAFLKRIKSHGFTITAMAFQDAYTLDIERLRRCSLQACNGDKRIPFCARYLTGIGG